MSGSSSSFFNTISSGCLFIVNWFERWIYLISHLPWWSAKSNPSKYVISSPWWTRVEHSQPYNQWISQTQLPSSSSPFCGKWSKEQGWWLLVKLEALCPEQLHWSAYLNMTIQYHKMIPSSRASKICSWGMGNLFLRSWSSFKTSLTWLVKASFSELRTVWIMA